MNNYQIIDAFKAAMRESGVEPPIEPIQADGKWHRYHIDGHKPGTKNGAYKMHLDGKPNGLFEDHKAGISGKWKAGTATKPLTQVDRQQIEATQKQSEEQRFKRYELTANAARHLLDIAKPLIGNDHPYLLKKRVDSHGLHRLKVWTKRHKNDAGQWESLNVHNVLLVPLLDINGKLWNLQAIFPESHSTLGRDKDFMNGGRLGGLFHVIGKPGPEVIICEGYATGSSLHTATCYQVLCAMSASNLLNVAQAVRAVDYRKKIIIAADNDLKTPGNPGLTAAKKASQAVRGLLAVPPIAGDFNDFDNMERRA